jgi:DNA-binding beta-propeller fold protein YncE
MGVVYRATQLALDRTVALKVLAPEFAEDEAFRERFQRESRLLAATDHPHVVTVHEAGEHEGRLYIVMRYIAGTDLRRLIKEHGGLEPARVAALATQVASALDAAHALGLIHRDVKPANVLIEPREGREHAYLADFGLTKRMASTTGPGGLTASGGWVGTADYIAPEQVTGGLVDGRVDVYALGCVVYTAMTGHVPFERDSDIATIFAHVNEPPPSLHDHAPELPSELDAALRRAMAKKPEDRFDRAGELAGAVAAGVGGEVPEPTAASRSRPTAGPPSRPTAGSPSMPTAASPSMPTAPSPPSPTVAPPRKRQHLRLLGLLGILVAVGAIAAIALTSGGGSDEEDAGDALAAERLRLEPIEVGAGAMSVAIGPDEVWVANSRDGTIRPIDAESGEPGREIEVGESPGSLTVAEDSVFVTTSAGRTVARVTDGRVTGRPVRVDTSEAGELATGEGFVFATGLPEGLVTKIDPRSGQIVDSVPGPEPGLDGPMAVGAGSVWIATNGNRGFVSRIDAGSLRVLEQVDLGPGSIAAGLAYGEGALWVADFNLNVVHQIDPGRNEVVRRVRVPTGISSDDIGVGGGAVWVASTEDGQVVRIDPKEGRVVGSPTPVPGARGSELAVGLGSAWLSNPDQDLVTRLEY